MKLFNTMTGEKAELVPIEEGHVRMYACGPTVYNFFHIGNARCFVVFDMLRRYLQYRGYKVTFAQNFTDVDDKIIKKANEEGITSNEVAEKYIKEYFTDAEGLGIEKATIHPRATENIDGIIEIVSILIEKGYAYESNGDVYFQPKKFKEYGKLSHMPIDELEAGARIDVSEQKRDPLDFALWKSAKPGEPYWESPWGNGRPGWHIECSAMVRKYLGQPIDIHCGGKDLAFPHHENEIAQSEAACGCTFANFWLHNGFISVDNEKMSKSLGNFFTVRDVAEKYGYDVIRYFLLSAHYRKPVNYSAEVLASSASALERIHNCEESLEFYIKNASGGELDESVKAMADGRREQFITAMDDDLNTADGISAVFELVKDANTLINGKSSASKESAQYVYSVLTELTRLLGINKKAKDDDDGAILAKIAERAQAKKDKNYALADSIRNELLSQGIVLEDTPNGTKYKKI